MSQSRSVRRCASTQSPPQAPLPSHGYIDNEADPDLGYHQFGARTYDPKLRRWLSPDPKVFAQPEIDLATTRQLNLYSYAGNDPARHSDPSGELVFLLVIPAISLAEAGVFAALATATVGTLAWAADQPPPSLAAGQARIRNFVGTAVRTESSAESKPKDEAEAPIAAPEAEASREPEVCEPKPEKIFVTYTKENEETGETYSGRTSGFGSPYDVVSRRDERHHMNGKGFGPAQVDESSTSKDAIRGREQQLIDKHGGAKSQGGTSGNAINGISNTNPNRQRYLDAARSRFDAL